MVITRMRDTSVGVPEERCAPCYAAQHGSGGGQTSGIDIFIAETIRARALTSSAPSFGRNILLPLLYTLLSSLSGMSVDSRLDAFPGNKPLASEVNEWLLANKPKLTSDQRAIVDGYTPRSLLAYSAVTVPAALVVGVNVTEAMVANREIVIMSRTDEGISGRPLTCDACHMRQPHGMSMGVERRRAH